MNSYMSVIGLFLATYFLKGTSGHSFVECTDYRADITGLDYSDDSCMGYARDWYRVSTTFGETSQKNNALSSSSGVDFCKFDMDGLDSDYTETRPYATYVVGSTIRLVWPAKNHANYECRQGIKDIEMKLFVDPTPDDDTYPDDIDDYTLIIDWHAEAEANGIELNTNQGTDGVPFQNCPGFCEETDNVPCYGDFELSTEMFSDKFNNVEGVYTFVWYWVFSSDTSIFTTCWEANVTLAGAVNVITDDNNGNTGNDDNDNDNDSENNEESLTYQLTIPVCYEGAAYDENDLKDAFDELQERSNNEIEFTITNELENQLQTKWNASVITNKLDSNHKDLALAWSSNGTMCDLIENEFGDGSCSICGGASFESFTLTSNNNNNSNEDDGVKLAIGLIFVALLLIGLGAFYVYKTKIAPQKQPIGAKAESGMAAQIATSSNIQKTNDIDDGPRPTTRPPVPPPPPLR